MEKPKNDFRQRKPAEKLIIAALVIAILAITGVLGGVLELAIGIVAGVLGLVVGIVTGVIGLVIGIATGLLGLVLGIIGGIFGILIGLAPIIVTVIIVVCIVKAINGGSHNGEKAKNDTYHV